jgi:hypothetical protein
MPCPITPKHVHQYNLRPRKNITTYTPPPLTKTNKISLQRASLDKVDNSCLEETIELIAKKCEHEKLSQRRNPLHTLCHQANLSECKENIEKYSPTNKSDDIKKSSSRRDHLMETEEHKQTNGGIVFQMKSFHSGRYAKFNARLSTKMDKAMNEFSRIEEMDRTDLRFLLNGVRIHQEQTVVSAELENLDEIDVFHGQPCWCKLCSKPILEPQINIEQQIPIVHKTSIINYKLTMFLLSLFVSLVCVAVLFFSY